MLDIGTLRVKVDVDDSQVSKLDSSLSKVQQNAGKTGLSMKGVGNSITKMGKAMAPVTVALTGIGVAGVKSFAEVDKTMQLTNATMGNSTEEADMLNKAMKDAAANSTFGMSDAATATLNFARAGLDAEQAAAALAPAMNLAAGEGGDLDAVSSGLVATINGFHGSFGKAGDYANVFAAACNNSALDVDSLSHAMSVAAPIFSSAGYTVNDAALYMGVMANNGIEADKAANSLKTGLARLVSPTKDAKVMMDKLGISVVNSDGTMKDSVTVQKELHEAFGQLSESEQIAAASAIFGKNQMAPWLALINTAPDDVEDLDNSLENCADTTEEMANAMMSGFGGSLEKLKSSIDVAVTSIGEALAPIISKIADVIQNLVDKFNALDPAQQQFIATIGLVVAAIAPVLLIVGKLVSAFSKIGPAISVAKGAIDAIGVALAGVTAPIAAVIATIGVLVAAFITLWNTNEEFRNKITGIWDGIAAKFHEFGQAIVDRLNALGFDFNNFTEALSALWKGFCDLLAPIFEYAFSLVSDILGVVLDVLVGIFDVFAGIFTGDWEMVWTGIKEIFGGIWNGIVQIFSDAMEAIKGVANVILGWFGTDWETVWGDITQWFSGIWNSVCETWDFIWKSMGTVVESVINWFKTTFIKVIKNVTKFFTDAWDGVYTTVTGIWQKISDTAGFVWNNIFGTISHVGANIAGNISNVWNSVIGFFSNAFGTITNSARYTFNNLADMAWNGVSNMASNIWSGLNNIWNDFWDWARDFARSSISFPSIELPHFSVDWYTHRWGKVVVHIPEISVDWWAKAMDKPYLLDEPTIFGQSGGRLQAGGEAGDEVIVGKDYLQNTIGKYTDMVMEAVKGVLQKSLVDSMQGITSGTEEVTNVENNMNYYITVPNNQNAYETAILLRDELRKKEFGYV